MTKLTATQYFNATVDSAERNKETALNDFNENVTEGNLLYALEWAQNQAVTVALSDLWITVRQHAAFEAEEYGDDDQAVRIYSALTDMVESQTRSLMKNYYRPSNTDQFTNAVNGAKAEAASRFVDQANRIVEMFDKE